jgi:hypothetical protein
MSRSRFAARAAATLATAVALAGAPAATAQTGQPIADFVLGNLGAGVLSAVSGTAFGEALSASGIFPSTNARIAGVVAQIDQLRGEVKALHDRVLGIESQLRYDRLNALRRDVEPLLSDINSAMDLLRKIAAGSYADPTLNAEKRSDLLGLIKSKLRSQQDFLNRKILNADSGDDFITRASEALRAGGRRFWTHADSLRLFQIVGFYQARAAELLMLRSELEFSTVTKDSTQSYRDGIRREVQDMVDRQREAFAAQKNALPPHMVGEHQVLDTRSSADTDHQRHMFYEPDPYVMAESSVQNYAHHFGLQGVGGHRWYVPSLDLWRALMGGHSGNPIAHAVAQGWPFAFRCTSTTLPSPQGAFWTSSSYPYSHNYNSQRRIAFGPHDGGNAALSYACTIMERTVRTAERYY